MTGNKDHRLIPIFRVNYVKRTKKPFIGSISYHTNYSEFSQSNGSDWHRNFMPGFEAVHGYNLVNVSHFDTRKKVTNSFFEKPVLIKTLYYPSFTVDTLNRKTVNRNYYLLSVYDEDTNNDSFINVKDLRRLYYFDVQGLSKSLLIPSNYSVLSSEYDPANDYMYVFAKLDADNNGLIDSQEETQVFWIDLKNPISNGLMYKKNS